MTLTTWWTARPLAPTRRSVPVGVLVPCSGSKAIEPTLACSADPLDGAADDGLDRFGAAAADGRRRRRLQLHARRRRCGHLAAAAGVRVEAEAQRLVAGDRFGADELDVGGQRGRRAVEPARVDQACQARAPPLPATMR